MAVSREYVIAAFQQHLGRPPESEETIAHHMAFGSEAKVTWVLTRSKEYFRKKFRDVSFEEGAVHKILLVGNCQVAIIAKLIEAMSEECSAIAIVLDSNNLDGVQSGNLDLSDYISESNYVFTNNLPAPVSSKLSSSFPDFVSKQQVIPAISYTAYHPDMGYVARADGSHFGGATGDYHSMLCFWAWQKGLDFQEAVKLFNYEVFDILGYFSHKLTADKFLVDSGDAIGFDLRSLLRKWAAKGCFMHSLNHPKLFVLADVARHALSKKNIGFTPSIENYVVDDLASHPCWDVYPEVANKFKIEGSYSFKRARHLGAANRPAPVLSLAQFVKTSYDCYDANREAGLRLLTPPASFARLEAFLERRSHFEEVAGSPVVVGGNPYLKLKRHQLWRRAVEAPQVQEVDPVVASGLHLTPSSKVATAGSCFAQHISRTLSANGFSYYVAEKGDEAASPEEQLRLNFGVYSARYGNIYTSRQLLQLFDRAYGSAKPLDRAWVRKDGRFVDPFRPMVEPEGYATEQEVEEAREEHLRHVRHMFEHLDVFVFTLGLTETWRRREDGYVFPLAPGVAAGAMDSSVYEFVNFEVQDVIADLESFIDKLERVNPSARLILTVSPVPLVATYEDRHVLTSTTYSKSTLRSAADYIVRRRHKVEYFPSYEIITGSYNRGAYFDDDLRSVKEEGVAHVMRLFMKHYSSGESDDVAPQPDAELLIAAAKNNALVCEEEALDSGLS